MVVTATSLLDTMNEHLREAGGSVELVRQSNGGEYYESPEDNQKTIQAVDTKMRQTQLAHLISVLTTSEKLEWAVGVKEQGNDCYVANDFENAIQKYMDAMVGLDFGSSDEEAALTKERLQIPILNNLAACYIAKGEWRKVVRLCDQSLELEAWNLKALLRRSRGLTHMGKLSEAKEDIKKAEELHEGSASSELQLWRKALEKEKSSRTKEKLTSKQFINNMYNEEISDANHEISRCKLFCVYIRRFLEFRVDPKVKFE